jgi:hypothetical protein
MTIIARTVVVVVVVVLAAAAVVVHFIQCISFLRNLGKKSEHGVET